MDKVRGCGSEYLSHLEGLFVSLDNGQGGGAGIDVAHRAVAGEIPGVGDGREEGGVDCRVMERVVLVESREGSGAEDVPSDGSV